MHFGNHRDLTSTSINGDVEPLGRIAFMQMTLPPRIAVMFANGQGVTTVSDPDSVAGRPVWSHDGRLAYCQVAEGRSQIHVMDCNGRARNISRSGFRDTACTWSPDGERLAFCRWNEGYTSRIWTMLADGSQQRPITAASGLADMPAWSPDGRWIAFEKDAADGAVVICLVDPDGCEEHALTDGSWVSHSAAWSPDGEQILFTRGRRFDAHCSIYRMNRDGTAVSPLGGESESRYFVCCSPDGRWIAFDEVTDSGLRIGIMDSNGNRTKIFSKIAGCMPTWTQ